MTISTKVDKSEPSQRLTPPHPQSTVAIRGKPSIDMATARSYGLSEQGGRL